MMSDKKLKKKIPIAAMTSFVDEEENTKKAGMTYFFTKPLKIPELRTLFIELARKH